MAADINDCGGGGCATFENGTTVLGGADDYDLIRFDGGAVGAFGASDPHDQDPPATATEADEPTADDFREAGFAADGDATVRFVGQETVVFGVPGQSVMADLTNIGAAAADYVVRVQVTGGSTSINRPTEVDGLAGGATQRVRVPTDGLSVGSHDVVVTALNGAGLELATSTGTVQVVDPQDPSVRERSDEVLAELQGGNLPGLDGEVRSVLTSAIAAIAITPLTDVAVAKSCSPTTVVPGAQVTCTLTVTNAGPSPCHERGRHRCPAGRADRGGHPRRRRVHLRRQCQQPPGVLHRAALPVGSTKVITVVARVGADVGPQTALTDTAKVSSDQVDPEAADNTSSFTVTTPTCTIEFQSATKTPDTINGTQGNDVICGSRFSDTIDGKGGSDIIFGLDGSDIINGGAGNDTIFGGAGNDIIEGNSGNDTIYGGAGDDILNGSAGTDTTTGAAGQDICTAERRFTCES